MIAFELLTIVIALLAVGAFAWAILHIRDVFHPFAFLMPMVLYMYVYLPYKIREYGLLEQSEFSASELIMVQSLNAACIFALIAGCAMGARNIPPDAAANMVPSQLSRVFTIALLLGGVSLVAFAVNINNVGGLFEAYSQEKGGGTAESGYTRDAIFWSISALAALAVCIQQGGLHPRYMIAAAAFGAPMLIHGLLGARRGPSFIAFSALTAMYYLGRNKRPTLPLFLGGGVLLGLLLLLIVNFRDQFRIGSDLFRNPTAILSGMMDTLSEAQLDSMERTLGANEFMYGADVVTRFSSGSDSFYWGTRILTIMFIRPIPSQLWPSKYEDVGMSRYMFNVGLGGVDESRTVADGAAPGFVADLFAEFSWGSILASLFIGWGYGRVWSNAQQRNGLWLMLYVLLIALSIFLVTQSIEAILFRLIFTALPLVVLWKVLLNGRRNLARVGPQEAVASELPGR